MIKLPFEIIRLLWNCGNNRIEHLDGFAKEFCNATFDIVSTSPFVIQANNTNILLTRDENDPSIENYQYAVLTNKKPRKSDIIKGNIISIRWLKHPNFKNLQPNEIVASWRGKFLYKKENIQESILGLRAPQLGAIYAFMSKAQIHHGRNIIVMPTGTGKTETMLSILIANQCPKVLITVPSDALRDQISNKFLTLGILPEFGIVASDCNYPIVGVVKEGMDYNGWYTLIEKSNVIITTMPLITNCESAIIDLFKEKISHLFVDEAHHSEAKTWSEFIDSFNDEKVTLFTATPFRNDNRRLRGEFIYNFSLKEAQSQGYYKPINLVEYGEVLIAGVGTLGENETFCRTIFANEDLVGQLVSGEFIRMKTTEEVPSGYLFAWLSSDYGFRLLRNTQTGTKLCRPIPSLVLQIPVPILDFKDMYEIDEMVRDAHTKQHIANNNEKEAISMIECEIENRNKENNKHDIGL